jgi:hypothetical protein
VVTVGDLLLCVAVSPEDGDRIQYLKLCFKYKNRAKDNVQNCSSSVKIPWSKTSRPYVEANILIIVNHLWACAEKFGKKRPYILFRYSRKQELSESSGRRTTSSY